MVRPILFIYSGGSKYWRVFSIVGKRLVFLHFLSIMERCACTKLMKKIFKAVFNRGRQWGTETRTEPLPIVHDKPTTSAITVSRAAIVLTVIFWAMYVIYTIFRQFFEGAEFHFTLQAFSYLIVVTFLTFSALMYLFARQGALQRFSKHRRVPRAELEQHFQKNPSSITVLVPSYAEEVSVIRKTILSAVLQEFPNLRVVLLIDDNPLQNTESSKQKLEETRRLSSEITALLAEPKDRFRRALKVGIGHKSTIDAQKTLAEHYQWAANWLNRQAELETVEDHVDIFFVEQVLRELAKELELVARALEVSVNEGEVIDKLRLTQLYHRLCWIFDGEVTYFERKKYSSLSHEANKAMNLNSYIGLMGGAYHFHPTPDGTALVAAGSNKNPDLVIPDSEFILTLDADSILLRDYCLRLSYFLQQEGNERVAVVQTPYSSFREARTRIERLAGATTDVQHILHQGMTYYNATFWVGANAVIRKVALEDIVEKEWVGGFEVKRYIQDRTVIEDTESSIDLALKGWSLVNYPERLSYSATPPDFGSLVIQRRRWANGGLLIMPKWFARLAAAKRENKAVSLMETLLRVNYMASIAWASFGLILLLAFPYNHRLLSPLVVLAALPYFLAMASDLKYSGYSRLDVLRIYGFNLILLPVNLAGVLKSLHQSLSGEKIPFARTPKVKDRTVSPLLFVLAPLVIVGFSVWTFIRSYQVENWGNVVFAAFNALLALYAIAAYIGIGTTLIDIWLGLTDWLYVDRKTTKELSTDRATSFNWQAVLYHGHTETSSPHGQMKKLKKGKSDV